MRRFYCLGMEWFVVLITGLACVWGLAGEVQAGAGSPGEQAKQRPPNILFVMLDNVGRDWFGCYGSDEGQTPEIDKLAATGLRFEHCYVTPLCSTSRVQLLTGRYPFRTGWHTHHDAAIYGGGNLDWNREYSFARVMQSAGYATAIAGKWQVNNLFEDGQQDALLRHGFDEYCIWPEAPLGHPASSQRYWDPYIIQNGERRPAEGRFGPDVYAEYLIEFMRRQRDRPFLAYYSAVLTHGPVVHTPLNRNQKGSSRELFAGMVRYADYQMGQLVAALEELELRDNTIILFTTDNGTDRRLGGRMAGQAVTGGLYTLNELGLDVPFIVNCPALVPGGRVSNQLIDSTDVLPTMAELGAAKLPENTTIDGHSFAAAIYGRESAQNARQWIFAQYADTRIVRDQRFKLYSSGRLFDLTRDPAERQDLSQSRDQAVVEARARLQQVLDSLPPDADLPFQPRSISAFQLRRERLDREE